MIFDHVSVQWGRWDTVDMDRCRNITFQDCIIGRAVPPQRFGCLCQSENISFIRNLWISNQSRNPKAKGTVQFINNVVYNWGVTGYVGGHSGANHYADLINNYSSKAPPRATISSAKSNPRISSTKAATSWTSTATGNSTAER